jgi:hypothetical protein
MPCIIELAKYFRKNNFLVGKTGNFQSWITSYILVQHEHSGSREVRLILVILFLGLWNHYFSFPKACLGVHSVPNHFLLYIY